MRETKQVGILSDMGSLWQPHPTQDQPAPRFEIDSRIGAAALRGPSASKKDIRPQAIRPQAILKFHHPSSLDYRAHHRLPVEHTLMVMIFCYRYTQGSSSSCFFLYVLANWHFSSVVVFDEVESLP